MYVYLDDTERDGLWSVAGRAMAPPLPRNWKGIATAYPLGSHMKEIREASRFKDWVAGADR